MWAFNLVPLVFFLFNLLFFDVFFFRLRLIVGLVSICFIVRVVAAVRVPPAHPVTSCKAVLVVWFVFFFIIT